MKGFLDLMVGMEKATRPKQVPKEETADTRTKIGGVRMMKEAEMYNNQELN